jgi:hypothetical protein
MLSASADGWGSQRDGVAGRSSHRVSDSGKTGIPPGREVYVTNLDLRPLSLGEILDRTFSLYRQHFVLFVGITALPQLFVLAIDFARLWLRGGPIARVAGVGGAPVGPFGALAPLDVLLALFIFAGVYVVVHPFASGGVVFAVSEIYFGRATTIGASLRRSWSQLGRLLPVFLVSLIAISSGILFFLVPGIYVPAALLENFGTRDTLERSLVLTQHNAGRSFVIFLLYYCLIATASGLLVYPFSYAAGLCARDQAMVLMWLSLAQLGGYLAGILVHPILTIGATVFYYDLRVRKEALDLQLLMNQTVGVESQTAGVPPTLA